MAQLDPQSGQLPGRLSPMANAQLNLHLQKRSRRYERDGLPAEILCQATGHLPLPLSLPHSDQWLGDPSAVHVRAKNKEPRGQPLSLVVC